MSQQNPFASLDTLSFSLAHQQEFLVALQYCYPKKISDGRIYSTTKRRLRPLPYDDIQPNIASFLTSVRWKVGKRGQELLTGQGEERWVVRGSAESQTSWSCKFILSSLPNLLKLPPKLPGINGLHVVPPSVDGSLSLKQLARSRDLPFIKAI